MILGTFIEDLKSAARHATETARSTEAALRGAEAAVAASDRLGVRPLAEELDGLRERLAVYVEQAAAIREALNDDLATAESMVATHPPQSPLAVIEETDTAPWWKTYAAPIAGMLFAALLCTEAALELFWQGFDRYAQWTTPLNVGFACAAVAVNVLGKESPLRAWTGPVLWGLMAFIALSPVGIHLSGRPITPGHITGMAIGIIALLVITILHRKKRTTQNGTDSTVNPGMPV